MNSLIILCKRQFIFFPALILFSCSPFKPYGAKYIVDSTADSSEWSAAEWTNYPEEPDCTPCTPETAMKNAAAGDIVYFRGEREEVTI